MKHLLTLALLVAVFSITGCASHPNVITRSGTQPMPAGSVKIALMAQPQPQPQEVLLASDLSVELKRRGFQLVSPAESDYTLASTIEDNWLTSTFASDNYRSAEQPFPSYIGSSTVTRRRSNSYYEPETREVQVRVKGIRLRLLSSENLRKGKFETAWEGYIESGIDLKREQQPILLRTLLDHLGQDFVGHVKITK